ncbi:PfkB family carbohydrate kinase [Agromyces salentinus]|uniref:PfkB family carbohydrate kinase n=1 Tax=Agromyces salentinus TaxID=269421 RepID=A0ABP4ZAE3_9MICO|nr:PfkB family carbohydrate kinase [Agromyces salentinus]
MNVVVVGDCLLDVDLGGTAARLSPDAPVPVVDVTESVHRAGGAGLVATMLARDGVDVTLVTALASDAGAARLRDCLAEVRLLDASLHGPTPVKTRLRAEGHAIARLDEGCGAPAPFEVTSRQLVAIAAADVVIAADYGRGLLADIRIRRALARRARVAPVVWDPHPRGTVPVPGVALATPNRSEAGTLSGHRVETVGDAMEVAETLRDQWRARAVGITLGERGAVLAAHSALPAVLPAERVDAADPCGAGDRLAASAAIALAEGHDTHEALRRGVAHASAYLGAGGVASLRNAPAPSPITRSGHDAFGLAAATRAAGGSVVATGGCFDLLHAGHVRTLQAARALGDCLVVCLNSDDSVRRLKGRDRPIIAERDRVDLLLALECVDAVVVFDEDTPVEVLRRLAPDLWVKGGDYSEIDLPESAVLAESGGRAVTVPYHPARSTSRLAAALAAVG